jgi:hypothetical protein
VVDASRHRSARFDPTVPHQVRAGCPAPLTHGPPALHHPSTVLCRVASFVVTARVGPMPRPARSGGRPRRQTVRHPRPMTRRASSCPRPAAPPPESSRNAGVDPDVPAPTPAGCAGGRGRPRVVGGDAYERP